MLCRNSSGTVCRQKIPWGTARDHQVLHTWNQELDYHVHMHCIVSGGGLTPDRRIRKYSASFSSRSESSGISFRENISPSWRLCISRRNLFFFLLQGIAGEQHLAGVQNSFMEKTGALTSRRPSTALVTPSNIWGAIPTRSQSPTAGSFRHGNKGCLLCTGQETR